jgi:ankyrin repeat protein
MLEAGFDVNETGGYLGSAIQAASSEGHMEVVKLLLEHGADVNLCAGRSPPPIADASLDITKLLLDHGANVNDGISSRDPVIFRSCTHGDAGKVKLLLEHGVDANLKDVDSTSLIQVAASCGNVEVAKLLLAYGADVDAREDIEPTAFEIAISNRDLEMAELLALSGANADEGTLARLRTDVASETSATLKSAEIKAKIERQAVADLRKTTSADDASFGLD